MARWILAVTVTVLLCGGCGITAVETPTPTPPFGPTGPSPTPSPTPIETPIPEPTPTPGPTPTPVLSCPPTPTTAAEIVAMSVPTAAACYGDKSLTIGGYSVGCASCGGVDEYDRSPAWLALNVPKYSLGPLPGTPGTETPTTFPVFIDPATGIVFPGAGAFVQVTGHFNDPIAETCRATPKPGSSVSALDPTSVITACRASFVVTAVSEVTP